MPKLRALRNQDDINAVPVTEPVTVDLSPEPEKVEIEVVAEPEKVVTRTEPEDENPLQKALDAQKNAEALAQRRTEEVQQAQRERDDAVRLSQERGHELTRERGDREQAQYDAILNAIGAQQSELESAKRDLKTAGQAQDWDALADAQARLAGAQTQLVNLENGKSGFESRRDERPKVERTEPTRPSGDPVESTISGLPLSGTSKDWLRNHHDFMTDPRKNAKLQAAHWDATDAGPEGSPAYLEALETSLGMRKKPDPDPDPDPEPQRRINVSAPVSRESVSVANGRPTQTRVTLSPEQRDAARISGVDEKTYAANVLRLNELKKQGHYNEGRG